jgi:hypothetical protein
MFITLCLLPDNVHNASNLRTDLLKVHRTRPYSSTVQPNTTFLSERYFNKTLNYNYRGKSTYKTILAILSAC